ncbi:MAG: hypothetical protein ACJ0QM_04970 [Schleiferiaceae bacterium]|jgi:hypothetical protein|nr:MAG: hypothetical protein CBB74_00065 [Owenweeksia sp. TMED14]|tara:strand:+ start:20891 stop:21679 length:789 start_codon:yes stop_codon:yes gene_type:complete
MKNIFLIILMVMSVLAFGQEVPTNTPDTSAVESTEAAAPESTETNMESTEVIVESTEDAAESAEESATETAEDEDALETLQKALVEEEQTVAENSDSEGDSPDVDIEDSEDLVSGPSLVIGLGVLPTHSDIGKGNISTPLRFSVGADDLFSGFGLIALYESGSAVNGPYVDNDGGLVDNYARFTLGPTYRFNKFRVSAAIDLFGPKGFFLASGADDGIVGSGRKFIGVSYDVFKGFYVGVDFSAYAGIGVMLNYSIPLGGVL